MSEKMLFCCGAIGHHFEVWMWRQLVGGERVETSLLTWEYINREQYPLNGISTNILKYVPMPPNATGLSRWWYRLRCIPEFNFYATIGRERKEIEKIVEKLQPDIILAQYGFMGLRILPVAKKYNIPLVVHFHGLDLSSSLNNRWYRWSLMKHLHQFSSVIVVGSHQKEWMLEHDVLETKVHLIPCGVPVDEFNHLERKRSGVIRFIAVSRLVEKKGLEYSIRAFAIVENKHPKIKFDIYGDGPLKSTLMELVEKLGLVGKVNFKGSVSPKVVENALAESNIFLQHSIVASNGDSEGFPVATTEAAAAGLPVVSTISPGMVEQVIDGKTGFLVEQKDYEAMAERMLQLACDADLRQKMGHEGRKRMFKHFDTKKQIAELEDVLLNCAKYE